VSFNRGGYRGGSRTFAPPDISESSFSIALKGKKT